MFVWFRVLDKLVSKSHPLLVQGALKMVIDQGLFCPTFLAVFYAYNALLEERSLAALKHKFRHAYIPTLLANYKVWPAVQIINFCLVPLNYRLLFVNVVALGWNAYLSLINARHSHTVLIK